MKELFFPVVRHGSIRLLLTYAVHIQMISKRMDIKTAYLNGDIDMTILKRLFTEPGRVGKLNKSIYGLKQSPRLWN